MNVNLGSDFDVLSGRGSTPTPATPVVEAALPLFEDVEELQLELVVVL